LFGLIEHALPEHGHGDFEVQTGGFKTRPLLTMLAQKTNMRRSVLGVIAKGSN
jgi:hypothetical protein